MSDPEASTAAFLDGGKIEEEHRRRLRSDARAH
jgi:hypothetical protein